jgi:aminoglycoside phosphotransferase (APT) family kinase protein
VVKRELGGARVVRARRLPGGLSTTTHAVRIESPAGVRRSVVLRRYTHPLADEQRPGVEWNALRFAAPTLPVPEPLWHDQGASFGVPALIESKLPGRAWYPAALAAKGLDEVAGFLAALHALPASDADGLPHFSEWLARDRPPVAPDHWHGFERRQQAYDALFADVRGVVDDPIVVTHGDPHVGNVLWSRGRMTGVIDWEMCERAPRAADVAYTMMDITLFAGDQAADRFLRRYEELAGAKLERLGYWKVMAAARALQDYAKWVPVYRLFGATDVTVARTHRRLTEFLHSGLASV